MANFSFLSIVRGIEISRVFPDTEWKIHSAVLSESIPVLVNCLHAADAAGGHSMHKPTPIAGCILACSLLAAASTLVLAQAAPPAAPAKPAVGTLMPPAQVYGKLLSGMEQEFVGAAEAMPEDKYDFAPPAGLGEFKGVRTFGQQIKHVAEANYYFFSGPNYSEADDKVKSDAIEKLTSKADIVKALKDSFALAHAAIDSITPENAFVMTSHGTRAGMAAFGIAHFMDHYGQMVVYLRMNGIVPPASRGNM
jgi:uncharacterized damage-inducible protein DinB